MKKLFLLISIVLFFIASCTFEKREVAFKCDSIVHFNPTIDSLITHKCATSFCHDHTTHSGGGDFSSYAGIKMKFDNGALKRRVIELMDMPTGGATITQAERDEIHCWIDQGGLEN